MTANQIAGTLDPPNECTGVHPMRMQFELYGPMRAEYGDYPP